MYIVYDSPCLVDGCGTNAMLESASFDPVRVRVTRTCRKGHRTALEVPLRDVNADLQARINDRLLTAFVELGIMGGVEE